MNHFYKFVLITVFLMLSSCQPDIEPERGADFEISITDESPSGFAFVDRGESLTANLDGPEIYISRSVDDSISWAEWVDDPSSLTSLEDLDYDSNVVIAVFRGRSSSNAGIKTTSVEVGDGEVIITVELLELEEGQFSSTVISYPFEIISIPAEPIKGQEFIWKLQTADGDILAERR